MLVRVEGRLGCKGDQPLDELAMMLSLVGSNFLEAGLSVLAVRLLLLF